MSMLSVSGSGSVDLVTRWMAEVGRLQPVWKRHFIWSKVGLPVAEA